MLAERDYGGIVVTVVVIALLKHFAHGRLLKFYGWDLHFTLRVTKAKATRLGNYLVHEGCFDGEQKTVQLDREGRTYQVRVVVKKGIDSDPQAIEVFRVFAAELSRDVFRGSRVEIHLCDEWLRTLRVVVPFG